MELNDKIAEKEKEGRDKFISVFSKKEFIESDNPSSSWDLSGVTYSIEESDKNFFVEIKDREYDSNKYKTCIMELKKYQYLKSIADDYDANFFYSCSYTDNVLYIFNLRKLLFDDINITTIRSPKVSLDNKIVYVDKLMIELPFVLGKKYKIKQ